MKDVGVSPAPFAGALALTCFLVACGGERTAGAGLSSPVVSRPVGERGALRAAARAPSTSQLPSRPARSATDDPAPPPAPADELTARWERRALNALLVPLLEPDGPPLTWVALNELLPCRDGADVRVDGRPVPHGAPVPLHRRFVVSFRLDDCWPLDSSWVGLSGTLEMIVVHAGPRLIATVRPLELSAVVDGVRVPIRREFVGEVSLAAAAVRP